MKIEASLVPPVVKTYKYILTLDEDELACLTSAMGMRSQNEHIGNLQGMLGRTKTDAERIAKLSSKIYNALADHADTYRDKGDE